MQKTSNTGTLWLLRGFLTTNVLLALTMPVAARDVIGVVYAVQDPLGILIFGVGVLTAFSLLLMTFVRPQALIHWGRREVACSPRLTIWLGVLFFWTRMLWLAGLLAATVDLVWLLPFFAWTVTTGLALVWLAERDSRENSARQANDRQALVVAIVCAAIAMCRDAFLLWGFSFGFYPDSHGYMVMGKQMLDISQPVYQPFRTWPYPIVNALARSWVNPMPLIWFQMILGAFAVGMLVRVIGKRDLVCAIVVGGLLSLDIVWGSINRQMLTEGPITSLSVICFAVLVSHFDRRGHICSWELLVAGLLYCWTFLMRPSNLGLALLIIGFYLWLTRSLGKTAYVVLGTAAVVLSSMGFNLWRSHNFELVSGPGFFEAFPLFSYQIFSPENGPASRRIDNVLRECLPDPGYSQVTIATSNDYIHGKYLPCWSDHGWAWEEAARQISNAYVEAILRRPLEYGRTILREASAFLAYPVAVYAPESLNVANNSTWIGYWATGHWASHFTLASSGYWGTGDWKSHLTSASSLLDKAATIAAYVIQPYLLLGPRIPLNAGIIDYARLGGRFNTTPSDAASFIVMVGALAVATRGRTRFMVVGCAMYVLYVGLSVVTGHVFIPRYAAPLSPFYDILSGVLAVAVGRAAWQGFKWRDIP